MENRYLLSFIITFLLIIGCANETPLVSGTTYKGVVVEQNSMIPIEGLIVKITDGNRIYSEAVTDKSGQFSLEFNDNYNLGRLYIYIDGNGVYPSKEVALIYTEDKTYYYGMIFLYDQTDKTLYPQIENVSWDYPNGDNVIRFNNIIINSEYSLTTSYIDLSTSEDYANSKQYQLELQDNGTYSVLIYDVKVGVRYYFRVVSSNAIGTNKTATFNLVFGYPLPVIEELLSATTNSVTIRIKVSEDPLSTSAVGLCWSTNHNPTINDNNSTGNSVEECDVIISGLNFYVNTYYVRAFAENANGIAYSEEIILPVNNPFNLPTFSSGNDTFTYIYMGKESWYNAYNNCKSLVYVFEDWSLPSFNIVYDLINAVYSNKGNEVPLPLWSMRRNEEDEDGESETYMITTQTYIMESKMQEAHYYAVRKITK